MRAALLLQAIFALFVSALLTAPLAAQTAPEFRPGGAVTQSNPQPVRLRCWDGTQWLDCTSSGGGGGSVPTGTAGSPNSNVVTVQGITGAASIKTDTVVQASAADRGLSVTTAGSAQQLMAANSARRGFTVQNQSSGDCYINGQTTATQDFHSLIIASGAYYETPSTHVSTGAISIVCAVSSASIYAREW